MQTKVFKTIFTFSLVILAGIFLMLPASAQELPAGVGTTNTTEEGNIEQLPAGVDDPTQPTDEGTVTANASSSQRDFLTGLAAGAAAGFIIGGIVVWYVKRG